MSVHRASTAPHRAPAAFTIVELLVSTVLLAVGLLAIAGTAVSIGRAQRGGAAAALASSAAESRLERVRAERCAPAAGDSSIGTLAERWGTLPLGGGIHELDDSIRIATSGSSAARTEIFRSALQC